MKRAITLLIIASAGIAALHAVGRSFTGDDPVVVALDVVRVGAIGVGVYLEFVASLSIVARLTGSASTLAAVSAVTMPSLLFLLGPVASAGAQPTGRDVVTMHLLDVDAPRAPAPAVAPPQEDGWTVAPGDSFWSIASETLRDARGDEPSDDDVLSYWRVLLDANQDNLAVPGNPDLLFAGQVVVLPPVSAA